MSSSKEQVTTDFRVGDLGFDDVLLKPQKGIVRSRDDVVLSTRIGRNYWSRNPIISSPMSTVTEWEMARAMSEAGGLGIIHRFNSVDEQIEHWKKATKPVALKAADDDAYRSTTHWAGCAVGTEAGYERIEKLYEAGCKYFVVDVAHGHSINTEKYMEGLDGDIKFHATIIGGSIATAEGANFLADLGFDGVRVGIGNGSACTTRTATGFGVPQLSAILQVSEELNSRKTSVNAPIAVISCGGCRTAGDIVKALAAGASAVILGRLLAGCKEAPKPGEYYGEASTRRNTKFIEGDVAEIEASGSVKDIVDSLCEGIKSGISYGGASSIRELQANAQFVRVSRSESGSPYYKI